MLRYSNLNDPDITAPWGFQPRDFLRATIEHTSSILQMHSATCPKLGRAHVPQLAARGKPPAVNDDRRYAPEPSRSPGIEPRMDSGLAPFILYMRDTRQNTM